METSQNPDLVDLLVPESDSIPTLDGARASHGGPLNGDTSDYSTVIDADGQPHIEIDQTALVQGDYSRAGHDLLIHAPDGATTLITDYFAQGEPAALISPFGNMLLGHAVELLAGPASPAQYAQAGGSTASNPIGQVSLLQGAASVQHADGTTAALSSGAQIFQDDVISTGDGGKMSIKFIDGTALTMSANARMILDELVYDPNAHDNSMVLNLVQGAFVFTTGLVAKTGTVRAETPVATMGIRGTTPVVNIDASTISPDGTPVTTFGIAPDPNGEVGAYQIINLVTGEVMGTVSTTDFVYNLSGVNGQLEQLLVDPALQSEFNDLLNSTYQSYGQGPGDQPNDQNDQNQGGENHGSTDPGNHGSADPDHVFATLTIEGLGPDYLQLGEGQTGDVTLTIAPIDDSTGQPEALKFTVTGQNDPPVINPIDTSFLEDSDGGTVTPGVSDPDSGDTLTYSIDTTNTIGLVTLNPTVGSFTYDPNHQFESLAEGEQTTDSFIYTVADSHGASASQVVTVTIDGENDAPSASDVTGEVDEDGQTMIAASFTDVDTSDSHTFSVDTTGTLGQVTNNGNGTFTFDPNGQFDYLGIDSQGNPEEATTSFTYTVDDGHNGTSTATATVTVTGVNDAPEAVGGDIVTNQFTPISGQLEASDVDKGSVLTFSLVAGPQYGTLDLNDDGSFTFTPSADAIGTADSFTYAVSDGVGGTAQATYDIDVHDLGLAVAQDTFDTSYGQSVNMVLTSEAQTDNDSTFVDFQINVSDPQVTNINVSIAFDASGSMGNVGPDATETRYDLQMQAIQNTIDDLRAQFDGSAMQVDVQMVQFSGIVTSSPEFLAGIDLYDSRLDDVAASFPYTGGATNLDHPLQAMLDFLQDESQAGDQNFVILTSDGRGQGSIDDLAHQLQQIAYVSAFEIDSTAPLDLVLNRIDSDNSPVKVDSADDLSAAFSVPQDFGVDLVDFQLTLDNGNGGDPVVVADQSDLVQNGSGYSLSIEALHGLAHWVGDDSALNTLTAIATFDTDGALGDETQSFTIHNTIGGSDSSLDITGSEGNDFLAAGLMGDEISGLGGDDLLMGFAGNDKLDGGEGNDILIGGLGYDQLAGGGGDDLFVIDHFPLPGDSGTPVADAPDLITDFNTDEDSLDISRLLTAAFDTGNPDAFVQITASTVASDDGPKTVVHVSVDADGPGGDAAMQVAATAIVNDNPEDVVMNIVFDDAGHSVQVSAATEVG
ncbi:MAG: Ig-like domain-containing protein [Salaquimonas sp.]|nr:Ig-like domain-containing protein [Salaquimonas sp.]